MNVDENFVVPEGFKEVTGDFVSGDEVNTVYWTWIGQTWKGIKICFADGENEAVYIDLGPADFQFKSDDNPYGAKLPVCGRIFNNRNALSMSLVDLMKPHQIGYNLCMNQLYQLLEKEIGKFLVMALMVFTLEKLENLLLRVGRDQLLKTLQSLTIMNMFLNNPVTLTLNLGMKKRGMMLKWEMLDMLV